MRFFASFLSMHRRKTQRRLVRAMVCLLGLALLVANTASASMPIAAMAGAAHATAATAPAANHCDGESDHAPAKAPHGEGCPCCDGTSCACAHVCGDVTILAALGVSSVVSTRVPSVPPARDYATPSAPLLRPPIG